MKRNIRDQAVANVDRRHGYTSEFSSSPEAHLAEYNAEEERLRSIRTMRLVVDCTLFQAGLDSEQVVEAVFAALSNADLGEGVSADSVESAEPVRAVQLPATFEEAWAPWDVMSRPDTPKIVQEGWWHPNTNSGRVHDHPEHPGRGWSSSSHRLCEPVYTKREVQR